MQIIKPKPANESQTYTSAGRAKLFSVGVAVLSSLSGATFLGAPLLDQFLPQAQTRQIQAFSALVTTVLGAYAASCSQSAQVGRLNASGLVYTPDGKQGLNHSETVPVMIPEKMADRELLSLVSELSERRQTREIIDVLKTFKG